MTTTCPDLLVLSQLLDGELEGSGGVRVHVEACPACTDRLARVRDAEVAAHTAARQAPAADAAAAPGCLTPTDLVVWLDPTASARERGPVNEHLDGCDHCLGEALAAARTMARLDAGPSRPVPDALRARVASRWSTTPARRPLTELVVALGRAGAELVDRHLVAPFRDLVELAPAPVTLRATADVATLQFELRAEGTRIRTTVVPSGDAVSVTMVLADAAGAPLPSQRVSLQRHGRAVFSAHTDDAGQIALPSLERGVYEVSCPGVAAAFRLDLRSAS
jgi:hypothetical protein